MSELTTPLSITQLRDGGYVISLGNQAIYATSDLGDAMAYMRNKIGPPNALIHPEHGSVRGASIAGASAWKS